MWYTVHHKGTAHGCGHSFEAGDEIWWEKGVPGWLCYECAVAKGVDPNLPVLPSTPNTTTNPTPREPTTEALEASSNGLERERLAYERELADSYEAISTGLHKLACCLRGLSYEKAPPSSAPSVGSPGSLPDGEKR